MIQLRSFLLATDKSAVVKVYCIKVLKSSKNRLALLGDVIIVCVNYIDMKKYIKLKARHQKMFFIGSMHRALIVRSKVNYRRINDIFLKFGENSIVIVTRSIVPLTNRVYGPILREFCMKWPSLGCVSTCII